MELLTSFVRLFIYLSCSCMVLSSITIFKLNCVVLAVEDCEFPAIFNFGDSNSDTGGLAAAFPSKLYKPYGETFFHEPAGRFSDGRLIIDFIAKNLNLSYLSAYLDSQRTNFKQGANFATGASTIRLPNRVIPNGGFSPFYLNVQYIQFLRLKSLSQKTYGDGAQKDEAGCAKPYNEVAQYFNTIVKEAVVQLRKDLSLAAITYVDVYSAKYLYTHNNGFEQLAISSVLWVWRKIQL